MGLNKTKASIFKGTRQRSTAIFSADEWLGRWRCCLTGKASYILVLKPSSLQEPRLCNYFRVVGYALLSEERPPTRYPTVALFVALQSLARTRRMVTLLPNQWANYMSVLKRSLAWELRRCTPGPTGQCSRAPSLQSLGRAGERCESRYSVLLLVSEVSYD